MNRKHISKIFIVTTMVLHTAFCYSNQRAKTQNNKIQNEIKIFGLVEVHNPNVYIVSNWTSRSRISYRITGDLKKRVAAQENNLLIVTGNLEKKTRWSGRIKVISINRVWHNNKKDTISGNVMLHNNKVYINELDLPLRRKGLLYEVSGNLTKRIIDREGEDIIVEGIIKQERNWSLLIIDVTKIIQ